MISIFTDPQRLDGLGYRYLGDQNNRAVEPGQAVLVSDQGEIYRVFPVGTRELVKTKPAPLSVPVGTRVRIS